MIANNERLVLGYELSRADVPEPLEQLLDDTIACYRKHYSDLQAVYVFGSVALGDWRAGVSDLDTIGISRNGVDESASRAIRGEMSAIEARWSDITFIDSVILGGQEIKQLKGVGGASALAGYATKLALTGICLWGEPIDCTDYVPTINEMAYGRTKRVEALMVKYRSGNLIDAFRKDQRLLARSSAKAAMRVLSGATLLRGAPYHASPRRAAEEVYRRVPEARLLSSAAMAIVNDPEVSPALAMSVADRSVELFYDLFPAHMQD